MERAMSDTWENFDKRFGINEIGTARFLDERFPDKESADKKYAALGSPANLRVVYFGWSILPDDGSLQKTNTTFYVPPPGTVTADISYGQGQHVVMCGEVQIGKLHEMLHIILHVIQKGKSAIVLFRPNNVDLYQFKKRLLEFNDLQKKNNLPVLPYPPIEIKEDKSQLPSLLKTPQLVIGLANPSTIDILNECYEKNPHLRGNGVKILDEADLFNHGLAPEVRIKTEQKLFRLFGYSYMFVSITATPATFLLCNTATQYHKVPRKQNYYGIDRISHKAVIAVRAGKRKNIYDPALDSNNLDMIMSDLLSTKESALLINTSKLCKDHASIISFLANRYQSRTLDTVYFEMNRKAVKVYNGSGKMLKYISDDKGKSAAIDKAMEEFKLTPYIIVVGGNLVGRGVSVVSTTYSRHLTHQYLVEAPGSSLVDMMQKIRLMGVYTDNPKLSLYCSQRLFNDLITLPKDIDDLISTAQEVINNKTQFPDLLALQTQYEFKWLSNRHTKGVDYQFKPSDYDIIVLNKSPKSIRANRKKNTFHIDSIVTNLHESFPASLLKGDWPAGGHSSSVSGRNKVERLVYCNTLLEVKNIHEFLKKNPQINKNVRIKLARDGYEYLDDLIALYNKHPEYEGKLLRQVSKVQPNTVIIRKVS